MTVRFAVVLLRVFDRNSELENKHENGSGPSRNEPWKEELEDDAVNLLYYYVFKNSRCINFPSNSKMEQTV